MKTDSPLHGALHGAPKRALRRLGAAACVMAVGLGLAGCGSDSAATVTLDFFQYKSEAADIFTKLARQFESEHNNIKINVNNSSDADTDLRTRLVKNRTPDVLTVNGALTFGQYAKAGIFYDWTGDELTDNLNEGMMDIAKNLVKIAGGSDDKLYGLPYAGNASGYIYNKDLFEQVGADPDNPPETWSDFIALLKKFQDAGITPIEATAADGWTMQAPLGSITGTLVSTEEYDGLKDGTKTFGDLWSESAEKVIELFKYAQDNKSVTYQQGTQAFANGEAAIIPLGTYAIPQVRLINKDINIGFAQMPATDDPDEQILTSGDDVMLAMSATTSHPKEAREFVEFLMGDEQMKEYIESQSAISTTKDTYVGDDALNTVVKFFEENRVADFSDHYVPSSVNIAGFLQTMLNNGNVEQFTTSMQTEYDKVAARTFE